MVLKLRHLCRQAGGHSRVGVLRARLSTQFTFLLVTPCAKASLASSALILALKNVLTFRVKNRERSKRDLTIADFNDTRNTALFAKKKWKVLVKHNKWCASFTCNEGTQKAFCSAATVRAPTPHL
eukprot:6213324-Pleurochrysis_carterae.AAC.1